MTAAPSPSSVSSGRGGQSVRHSLARCVTGIGCIDCGVEVAHPVRWPHALKAISARRTQLTPQFDGTSRGRPPRITYGCGLPAFGFKRSVFTCSAMSDDDCVLHGEGGSTGFSLDAVAVTKPAR